MKVASDFLRPALSSVYEVAGRFLLLDVGDPESAETIQRFLARWNLTMLSEPADRIDAEVIVRLGAAPSIPEGFSEFPLSEGAVGYACETAYRIVFPRAVLAADESNVVRVWLDQPVQYDQVLLPPLVSHAVSSALRRADVFELHSGAVVDKVSAMSMLICGPSGSGKSTLTLQLAAAGWNYLSDDVVLLGLKGDLVKAIGLRRFFALTRETVDMIALPQVKTLLSGAVTVHKLPLVPEELFPSGSIDSCQPNAILFVSVAKKEQSEVRALSAGETMSRLIRLCPWSCYDGAVARKFLDVLAKLVKQSRSFELLGGTDLLGEPKIMARFLTTAMERRPV